MKEIKLTQGKIALVDDDLFDYLNQWRWFAREDKTTFYARRNEYSDRKQISVLMHRVIMNTPPDMEVDHKDHNGLNCQRYNMRNCTHKQNTTNRIGWGCSGFKGVYLRVYKMKPIRFRAMIQASNKFKHLGYFNTALEAAIAYDKAAIELHGEFANLNFK